MHGSLSQRAFSECGKRNSNISKYFFFTNTKEIENGTCYKESKLESYIPQQTNQNIELNVYLKYFVDFKILSPIPV